MTFIVDPANEDVALDSESGEILGSIRALPIRKDGSSPTVEELQSAPLIGYGGKFTYASDDFEVLP